MIAMPLPDETVLARRADIVAALRKLLPDERVIDSADERRAYERDGLSAYRQMPMVVVLPSTVAQVAQSTWEAIPNKEVRDSREASVV